ncbi:MAG TPA: hypothetical protein VJJ83_00235 [Candidatus Babeliales bacterium]|nr:hypothetical protein [Candidatus Babeliales bacterium]
MLRLQLVSLQQPPHEYQVLWVELHTPTGNYIIQPGHAPMIVVLTPDTKVHCLLAHNREQKTILVTSGIAHVQRERVVLALG